MTKLISFTLNGELRQVSVEDNELLVDVLRDKLGQKGTKKSCGSGECGCCTVLFNGRAVDSCLVLAAEAQDAEIETIEGLAKGRQLHPLQEQFVEKGAVQCGFCTPGIIMSAAGLLRQNEAPSEEEVRRAITGNYCRCTGYVKPVQAILAAAQSLQKEGETS